MIPYPGDDFVTSFETQVVALYNQAGQPVDLKNNIWTGRCLYDVGADTNGFGNAQAYSDKHLAELRQVLGISPAPFGRSRIIHIKGNFCNLRDADDIPIFDIYIGWLLKNNPAKADDWLNRHRAAGSTHINIAISGNYPENLGWTSQYPIPGSDWTNNISDFSGFLQILIDKWGFVPIVQLAMDGHAYDPSGLTYGWQWGMNNVPKIINQLQNYIPYVLWSTGFDGCFPDWTRDETLQAITMLRNAVGPNGCIATEFGGPGSVSYCHMGQAGGDWTYDKLGQLDAFLVEVNTYPADETGVAQTATRLLGPSTLNAPTTPYYLSGLQKEIGICYYETCAFQAIRKQITPDNARTAADTGKKYGFTDFGNGLPH